MKSKILIFVFFLAAVSTQAQTTFQKTYGGTGFDQHGRTVQQTSDGGFIIAGRYGYLPYQTFLIKTNSAGDLQWEKTYSGINSSEPIMVQQTTNGGYIWGGILDGYGWLFKTDSNGNQVFSISFDDYGKIPGSVKQTSDGGYIVTGPSLQSYYGSYDDIFLVKFNTNGNIVWSKNFSGASNINDDANSVQQTNDGGFVLVGATGSFGAGGNDIVVIKTDDNGNISWSKTYGTSSDELGYSIQQTSDGGYIVAAGNYPLCYVLKLDNSGNITWAKSYDNVDGMNMKIQQTSDGGYILGGGTGSTGSDFYLLKLASNGNINWQKTYGYSGGQNFEYGYSLQQTTDGGFVIVGALDTTGGLDSNAVYLVKTDNLGNSGCLENNMSSNVNTITLATNSVSFTTTSGINTSSVTPVVNTVTPDETELCSSTGVNEIENSHFTTFVYPNPFTNWAIIQMQSNTSNATMTIYNFQGQVVKQINNITEHEIKIYRDNLQNGIYFFRVTQNANTIATGKLVITD